MKKKYFGNDDIISVYKFMERCGLHCEPKGKVLISHEIMMRKLSLRHEKFKDAVVIPLKVPFRKINREDVKTGNIVLVKDDLRNIVAYKIPFIKEEIKTDEKEKIREKLIEEYLNETKDDEMKKGYLKYLYKKSLRDKKRALEEIKEEYEKGIMEEMYAVDSKVNRIKKLENIRRY